MNFSLRCLQCRAGCPGSASLNLPSPAGFNLLRRFSSGVCVQPLVKLVRRPQPLLQVLQWLQIALVVCARARALLPAWVRAAQPADATALETVLLHRGTGTVCWCCRCTLSSVGHGTARSGVEPWRFPRCDGSVSLAGPRETRLPQFSSRSAAARRAPGGARTGALMGHVW